MLCSYFNSVKAKMSESDSEIELDPRIQIELEKLNITTDEINKLEIEYDVC